jgi:hypothetical protein
VLLSIIKAWIQAQLCNCQHYQDFSLPVPFISADFEQDLGTLQVII